MSPLLVLSLCFFTSALAVITHQPFATRATCGSTGRTCVEGEAKCQNGACVCWNAYGYTWGKGDFRCFKPGHKGCEIKNDPQLTTFGRETESFPLLCRYLVSHVRPVLKDRQGNNIGNCEAHIWAYNAKRKGKIFVLGFDVALKITYSGAPARVVEHSFRHYGWTQQNTQTITRKGTNGQSSPFVPNGGDSVTYNDNVNGVHVNYLANDLNNRFTYQVEGCGIEVTHVPYDIIIRRDQRQVPGLSVTVDDNNQPQWLSQDKAVCLVPGGDTFEDIQYDGLSKERSMLLRTFKNLPEQLLPFSDNGQCDNIGGILNDCQVARQKNAIRNCDWMLHDTQFSKCFDDSGAGHKLLGLFESCVRAWCINRPCTATIQTIRDSGCDSIGRVEHLAGFLAGNSCPPDPAPAGGR